MSNTPPYEQKQAARDAKIESQAHRSDHIFRHILHYVERTVATITLIGLILSFVYLIYLMFTDPGEYLFDTHNFLHNIHSLTE